MLVVLFDLAAHVQQEGAVGGVDHLRSGDRFDRGDDLVPVLLTRSVDDDVAHAVALVHLDQIDRADDAAGLRDRGGQQAERAVRVVEPDADSQAVLRDGCGAHCGCSSVDGAGC